MYGKKKKNREQKEEQQKTHTTLLDCKIVRGKTAMEKNRTNKTTRHPSRCIHLFRSPVLSMLPPFMAAMVAHKKMMLTKSPAQLTEWAWPKALCRKGDRINLKILRLQRNPSMQLDKTWIRLHTSSKSSDIIPRSWLAEGFIFVFLGSAQPSFFPRILGRLD